MASTEEERQANTRTAAERMLQSQVREHNRRSVPLPEPPEDGVYRFHGSTEPDRDVTPAPVDALAGADHTSTTADIDALPPTQYLVMEVLAARARFGETCWPFPDRLRPALAALADLGLLWWQGGNVPHTCRASLTDAGRSAVLSSAYQSPGEAERDELRQKIAEYENAITWETSCTSCATVLDSSIKDHDRAERAEAKLAAIVAYCRERAEEISDRMLRVRPEDIRIDAGDILAIISAPDGP